jgi:hypothetical protein
MLGGAFFKLHVHGQPSVELQAASLKLKVKLLRRGWRA